jgi:hypothetical protein
MPHREPATLHGYADRAIDIRIEVATTATSTDYTSPGFKIADVLEKTTGLTLSDDLTLSQADMAIVPGWHQWELYATRAGAVRSLAHGMFHIGDTPSDDESS